MFKRVAETQGSLIRSWIMSNPVDRFSRLGICRLSLVTVLSKLYKCGLVQLGTQMAVEDRLASFVSTVLQVEEILQTHIIRSSFFDQMMPEISNKEV